MCRAPQTRVDGPGRRAPETGVGRGGAQGPMGREPGGRQPRLPHVSRSPSETATGSRHRAHTTPPRCRRRGDGVDPDSSPGRRPWAREALTRRPATVRAGLFWNTHLMIQKHFTSELGRTAGRAPFGGTFSCWKQTLLRRMHSPDAPYLCCSEQTLPFPGAHI